MQSALKAAAISGLAAGAVAAVGLWAYLITQVPNATPVMAAVLSTLVGGVLAVVVAGLVFLVRKYPANAKVAAIFATGASLVLSAIVAYGACQNKEPASLGVHLVVWCMVWPLGFLTSLWVDVKRAVATKILDGVKARQK
jgi:predicted membrane-bound mannosyltransferase